MEHPAPQHESPPDLGSLTERARTDPRAFGELYRAHYAAIAGYLFRRTGDHHTAEDLAGETFMRAYRAIGRFRDQGSGVRPWLYRIATNVANRWAAQRGRLRLAAIPPGASAPGKGVEAVDSGVAMIALLDIAPQHQAVLVLHYVEGLSICEVAAALDRRVGTVKSSLSRARAEYARALTRRRDSHE